MRHLHPPKSVNRSPWFTPVAQPQHSQGDTDHGPDVDQLGASIFSLALTDSARLAAPPSVRLLPAFCAIRPQGFPLTVASPRAFTVAKAGSDGPVLSTCRRPVTDPSSLLSRCSSTPSWLLTRSSAPCSTLHDSAVVTWVFVSYMQVYPAMQKNVSSDRYR